MARTCTIFYVHSRKVIKVHWTHLIRIYCESTLSPLINTIPTWSSENILLNNCKEGSYNTNRKKRLQCIIFEESSDICHLLAQCTVYGAMTWSIKVYLFAQKYGLISELSKPVGLKPNSSTCKSVPFYLTCSFLSSVSKVFRFYISLYMVSKHLACGNEKRAC